MQTVIADLALESEAATALALRLAGAVDRRASAPFLRLALPAAKYLVCKRAPAVVAEALECLGGNGFVEDSGLPRLYREAPLNSIWEGSGNVTALDVLRAITREPEAVEAVLAELDAAAGADQWFDRAVRELRAELRSRDPRRARRMAELLALCLQGCLLLRHAPDEVAAAFVASRFLPDGPWRTAGTLPGRRRDRAPRRPGHPSVVTQGPGRPPLAELVERLVAERVDAGPGGQRVRDGDVQALDPVGHPAGADLGAERLDRVAFGEVGLVRAPVGRRQLRVLGEPGRHLPHAALGLQRADARGQPRAGEVVQRGERGAVGQARGGAHHRRLPARAPVRDVQHPARAAGRAARPPTLEIGLRRRFTASPPRPRATACGTTARRRRAPPPGRPGRTAAARRRAPRPACTYPSRDRGLRLDLGRVRQPGLLGLAAARPRR